MRPGSSPYGMSPKRPPGAHPPNSSIASPTRIGDAECFVRRRRTSAGCWTGGRVAPDGRHGCLPSAWTWGFKLDPPNPYSHDESGDNRAKGTLRVDIPAR